MINVRKWLPAAVGATLVLAACSGATAASLGSTGGTRTGGGGQ